MNKIKSFHGFFEVAPLMENIQAAKDYLIKKYAEKKKVKPSELSDEEKKEILMDRKFIEIKNLLDKQPGYVFPFLVFYIEQKAHIEELEEILTYLTRFKGQLSELSMPVGDFTKVVPDDEDHRPGYERLGDELRNIERRRKLKEFYNELTPRMKKAFNRASKEELDELTTISNQLKGLKDVVDDEGIVKNAWKTFAKTMKKYDHVELYPQYSDEKVALRDIIRDALDHIKTWGQDENALLKSLKELGPKAGILYSKGGYIAMSARTPEAQRAVCADTNWCIRTDSTFWSYGKGRVQINILNKKLPITNDLSLIGMTVNPDGTIHTDADRPNHRLRDKNGNYFRNYIDALRGLGYPEDLISGVQSKFEKECDIKLALEYYYREGESLTPSKIIHSLISMNKGFLSGVMPEEDWKEVSAIVAEIIAKDKGLSKSTFMKMFTEFGIYTEATFNVFDALVGKEYTKEEMEKIKETSLDGIQAMEDILNLDDLDSLGVKERDIIDMESIVANRDWIIKQFDKRI